jgi:hypothetical protein
MLQLCIFGGYEGPLSPDKKVFFTLFGGCTLHRPTLARQLLTARSTLQGRAPAPKMIVLTVFGNTAVICPTLAEEFIDLREAVNGGALNMGHWDAYMAELDRWQSAALLSLTLFGGFDEAKLPSDEDEINALALQRHFGNVGEAAGRILEMGVGQSGSQRRAIVQQAVMTG